MAYSSLEQSFMDSVAGSFFPGEQPEPQAEPIKLAAGPSQTMTDVAPGGAMDMNGSRGTEPLPEMKAYDPTMRERIASFLQAGFEGVGMDRSSARRSAQTLIGGPSSQFSLNLGLADIVPFLGTALQTEEAERSIENAVTLAKQGDGVGAAIEGVAGAVGLIPGAAGTVKATKKVIKSAADRKAGDIVTPNATLSVQEPAAAANTGPDALQVGQRAASEQKPTIGNGANFVETVQFVQLPDGKFATSTALQETKKVSVGFDRVSNVAEAAHITAGLRKSPQEQLVAVVLDENDKPIQIIRHTIGLAAQTSAEPFSLLGAIANTPGAKSFWLSHNHPSGTADLSGADRKLADALGKMSKDTGIEMRGILAIGKSKFAAYAPGGKLDVAASDIPAAARTTSLSMVERTFRKADVLDSIKVMSPQDAKVVADKVAGSNSGLVLFNNSRQAVAFIPMNKIDLANLRKTGVAKQLFSALEKANATASMYVTKLEPDMDGIANLQDMLSQAGSPMFDALGGVNRESLVNKIPVRFTDFNSAFPASAAAGVGAAAMQDKEKK